jgi:hypothetical protein
MLAALVGLVVVGFGAAFAWAAGVGRWGEVEPVTGRLALWAAGGALTTASPVTGHGLRHTVLVLPEGLEAVVADLDPGLHPWLPTVLVDRLDNDWLQVAVERGSPAVLLLLALWWRAALLACRRLRRRGVQLDRAILAALAALGFCSLISAPLHTPATVALFWVLAGLAGVEHGAPVAAGGCTARHRWSWIATAALFGAAAVAAGTVALEVHAANCQAGAGHRLLRAGQLAAAADRLRAPLRVVPWLTAASVDRARALVATGQAAESLVVIADGERWASSEWFWVVRSRALSQLGYPDRARRVLEEALRILPRSSLLLEARDESQP